MFFKPNLFTYIHILQHMSRIFGISYHKNEFGCNCDSVIFTLVVIWFGGCSLGTGFCLTGYNINVGNKHIFILLYGVRLIQAGLLICIVKFRCSTEQVKQILHLRNRLNEKNAANISFKHRRRTLVISALFLVWILCKAVQLKDLEDREKCNPSSTKCYLFKHACTYMSTWPLSILSWQFLVWMQVFSGFLKISIDELRCAIIKSQEIPCTRYQLQIFESVTQVKAVLRFKEKILHVFGPSIFFCQLRASLWIMLNAHLNSSWKTHPGLILFASMLAFNVTFSFLPYWVGQEITSEGSEMLSELLKLQVMKEPLIFSKRLSNFQFSVSHESLKFRVFNLFDLTHKQFLTFLSISIGFLIIQLQMIF